MLKSCETSELSNVVGASKPEATMRGEDRQQDDLFRYGPWRGSSPASPSAEDDPGDGG